ncbi:MAG: sulfur carrier protein ThiS adenylyltransferase ThiF [Peptococcaceae bacterium]|nr:sulfur carrier protein ThiS adenylyltransferase ThiF [Peptococcaceae bacterium]
MQIHINDKLVTTTACTYAELKPHYQPTADTLLISGRSKPWQTPINDGDEALLLDTTTAPTPEVWRAIYNARYGRTIMDKLQAGYVAICGLGGLGSLVALELARLGVGRLLLIDGDTVDPTNLARQHYTLAQIGQKKADALADTIRGSAPLTQVETAPVWLAASNIQSLLGDCPFICECLDRPETKALLTNTVLSSLPRSILIGASGMAGYSSGNTITAKQVMPRFYLVGDDINEGEEGIGLMAPRVGLCASAQATLTMRLLLGENTP